MFRRYQKAKDVPPPPPIEVSEKEQAFRARQRTEQAKAAATQEEMAELAREAKRQDRLLDIRMDLHKRVLESLNLAAIEKASESDLRREISAITREGMREAAIVLNSRDTDQLIQDLLDEVTGLGPLEVLLKDDSVNDILVNGPGTRSSWNATGSWS